MSEPFLSVIIPTIGRASLQATLDSIGAQPQADAVEIILVADGQKTTVQDCPDAPARTRHQAFTHDAGYSAWGHPQRNFGMTKARGQYLAFLDDDDVWIPGALQEILTVTQTYGDRINLFRMREPGGRRLWADTTLTIGNIGTPMMVVANDPSMLGVWGDRYEGDFDFLISTIKRVEDGRPKVRWCEPVICQVRPVSAASVVGAIG